jgi:hypothetical protein
LALVSVCASGAITAAAAFAEEALWLDNGVEIINELLAEITGTVELIDLSTRAGESGILCSGTFDGRLGLGSGKAQFDIITEVLDLNGVKIPEFSAATEGQGVECTATKVCEQGNGTDPPLAWPLNLPWLTELELMVGAPAEEEFLDLIKEETIAKLGTPGWHVDCLILTLLSEDTCQGEASADIFLAGTQLLGVFLGNQTESTCTQGGAASGLVLTGPGDESGVFSSDATELEPSSP